MTNQYIFNKDREYISHTYQRFPVAVQCGHGATAEDFEGKSYIDFGSGIGTNSLGFCNEGWVNAITEQLRQVQHTSNSFYTLPDVRLAERLCQETGYSKVFFGNSGAEANEEPLRSQENMAERRKASIVIRLLPLKILFMGGRLPRWRQQGRIHSISISSHLRRGSGMWRLITGSSCRMLLTVLYVASWSNLSRAKVV